MTSIPIIQIDDLCKKYGEITALDRLNLSVQAGDFLAIFGPNGAGKTTLLKMLSTLLSPDSGTIMVEGLKRPDADHKIRNKLGIISHSPFVYLGLTVEENLDFFGELYEISDRKERINELCQRLGLQSRRHLKAKQLSRGYLQRLSIARALLHQPSILLLDEPFTGLDAYSAHVLISLLQTLPFKAVLITTHRLEYGLKVANRACILTNGQIVFDASVTDMAASEWERKYLEATGG